MAACLAKESSNPLAFAHGYVIFAHKLCSFSCRDKRTRRRNLYLFCSPVRKLQVKCQQDGIASFGHHRSERLKIRNPKAEIRRKAETRNPNPACVDALPLGQSEGCVELRNSDFLRVSGLGFRISGETELVVLTGCASRTGWHLRGTTGVRPSPGAATFASSRAFELSTMPGNSVLAAPGDGRTPTKAGLGGGGTAKMRPQDGKHVFGRVHAVGGADGVVEVGVGVAQATGARGFGDAIEPAQSTAFGSRDLAARAPKVSIVIDTCSTPARLK